MQGLITKNEMIFSNLNFPVEREKFLNKEVVFSSFSGVFVPS
jgi:hypothetical protein